MPFCPGSVLMGADDSAVDDQILKVAIVGHGGKDAVPDAPFDCLPRQALSNRIGCQA